MNINIKNERQERGPDIGGNRIRFLMEGLKRSIPNPKVPEKAVYRALVLLSEDRVDEKGEIIPLSRTEVAALEEIRVLSWKHRPGVIDKLRQAVIEIHKGCCIPEDAPQEL